MDTNITEHRSSSLNKSWEHILFWPHIFVSKFSKLLLFFLTFQYPVIAVDNYVPIMDPFSGLQFGQISVLLAMGSLDQVGLKWGFLNV